MDTKRFLQHRWFIPFASCLGVTVGIASVLVLPFGVFIKPVTAEFGWNRGAMSMAVAIASFFSIVATPLLGRLIDRYGFKPVLIPGFVLFALSMSCLALIGPQIWVFYVIFAVAAFVGISASPLAYSKAVASWFDRERGLALGIATAGSGLGTVVMPLIATALIAHYGWRTAYVGLALISGVVSVAVVALFIREPPGFRVAGPRSEVLAPGMTAREAARSSWRFWALAAIFFLGGITLNGAIAHVVPLMTDRGLTPAAAAGLLSASGLAAVIARLLGGWCLDKLHGPFVTAFSMAIAALGMLFFWSGAAGAMPLIAVLCIGAGLGVEVDAMGFLISRYFGLKAFGEIYGWLFPAFTLGVGVGPALMGMTFDRYHSYDPMLLIFFFLLLVSVALLTALGPYTYPHERYAALARAAAE